MWLWMIAQNVPPDFTVPGASWTAAGLLALVLGWLLFRELPSQKQQVKELITTRDELVNRLAERFESTLETLADKATIVDRERRTDFKESLKILTDTNQRDNQFIREALTNMQRMLQDLSSK